MAVDLATLAIKVTSDGVGKATGELDQLTRAGTAAEAAQAKMATASEGAAASALKLAGAVMAAYGAYKLLSGVIEVGMRVETLGVAMEVVAKNAGIGAETLKYFTQEVKSAGITTSETFSGITKAMILGLDLNKMKDLATRARDIAVVAGQNTSETLAQIMHGIESHNVRIFHTLGIAVRYQKDIYDEYAASINKTGKELNQVEKAQAMLNEVLRASAGYAGAAAAADATVGKQIASMQRYAEDAKAALWELFSPGMAAGVETLSRALKDLQKWAQENEDTLRDLGRSTGEFVSAVGSTALSVAKWTAENHELLKTLAELYIISKVMAWIWGLRVSMIAAYETIMIVVKGYQAMTTATVVYQAAGVALTPTIVANTAAIGAMNAVLMASIPTLVAAAAALAAFGVYKSLTDTVWDQELEDTSAIPGIGLIGGKSKAKVAREQAAKEKEQFGGYEDPVGASVWTARRQAEARRNAEEAAAEAAKKSAGAHGEAGKAAEKAGQQMANIIDTLNKELARLSGDSLAEIEAWYSHTVNQIEKYREKGEGAEEAISLAKKVKKAKEEKLEQEYTKWLADTTGDRTKAVMLKEDELLKKFGHIQGAKLEIAKATEAELTRIAMDKENERLSLLKGQLDQMAQFAPLLGDQIALQRQALEIEKKMTDNRLLDLYLQNKINEETYNQAKAMQAVINQAKEYELMRKEWEKQDFVGGLKMFSYSRTQESQVRGAQMALEMMRSLEMDIGSGMARSFIGYLKGEGGVTVDELGWQMAEKFTQASFQLLSAKAFDWIGAKIGEALGVPTPGRKPSGAPGDPIWVTMTPSTLSGLAGLFGGKGASAGGFGGMAEFLSGPTPAGGTEGMAEWMNEIMGEQAMLGGQVGQFYSEQNSWWSSMLGKTGDWLGSLFSSVGSFFESIISGLAGIFSGGGGAGGGAGLGGLFSGLLGLFGFAEGGVVTHPMIARLAEAGKPEAVVPLSSGSIPVKILAADTSKEQKRQGMTNHFNITVMANNPREFFGSEQMMMARVGQKMNLALQKNS